MQPFLSVLQFLNPVLKNPRRMAAEREKAEKEDDLGLALLKAALEGNLAEVQHLISQGANINYNITNERNTPLIEAVAAGHDNVVDYLLACGADTDIRNFDEETAYEVAFKRSKELKLANTMEESCEQFEKYLYIVGRLSSNNVKADTLNRAELDAVEKGESSLMRLK